jgi:hypothetical protein
MIVLPVKKTLFDTSVDSKKTKFFYFTPDVFSEFTLKSKGIVFKTMVEDLYYTNVSTV